MINYEIIPHQNLIQSISTILREDKEGLPVFRYVLRCSSLLISMGKALNVMLSVNMKSLKQRFLRQYFVFYDICNTVRGS